MFSPQKQFRIALLVLVAAPFSLSQVQAQSGSSAGFEARLAAMQRARARGAEEVIESKVVEEAPVRVAQQPSPIRQVAATAPIQGSATRGVVQGFPSQTFPSQPSFAAPLGSSTRGVVQSFAPTPQPVISSPLGSSTRGSGTQGYVPGHLRNPQVISDQPIVQGTIIEQPFIDSPVAGDVAPSIGSDSFFSSEVIHEGEIIGDPCNTCGDSYLIDDCCGRGGCPGNVRPIFHGQFASLFRNASFFGGLTSFRHNAFTLPGNDDLSLDSNFGAFGGFNLGVPLCRILGGGLSAQFGVRSVQTHFDGSDFTDDNRDQTFFTAGIFRRVDIGLQAGVVVDVLNEDFFVESDLTQIRGEVSYAFPTGGALGFRFAAAQQDDSFSGELNGVTVDEFTTGSDSHFRFFWRKVLNNGGYSEVFGGWSNAGHGVLGADLDVPVSKYIAMEAGAVYFLSEEIAPTGSSLGDSRIDDSFNFYVGFALRPQGVARYRSYDQPLLPVADNGTFLLRRN